VVAERFPRLEARFQPGSLVRSARVVFRTEGGRFWYSVAMTPAAGSYFGVLPKPRATLSKLNYYIEVTGAGLESSRTEEHTADVVSGVGACRDGRLALALTSASVLVSPPDGVVGAPLVPAGFSESGVTAGSGLAPAGGAGGTTAAGDAAGAASTGGGTASTGVAAAGGPGFSAMAVLLGGAALAGGAVALRGGGEDAAEPPDPLSVDDDGDGLSENQGDCNDQSAQVAPNGSVVASVEDSYSARTVMCSEPRQVRISLRNNSCQAVEVRGIAGCGESISSTCPTGNVWPTPWCLDGFPPAQRLSVAAGTTAVVGEWSAANALGQTCTTQRRSCSNTQRRWYVVHTGAGDLSADAAPYTIDLTDCPICAYEAPLTAPNAR